ncbi:hypothetical protein MPDQ_001573 [Monascus purpureus]|uniref:Fatty acid desaturase domain-containing protein n=1 Tax=Monascus purpureus TaxID=5098 RepID=A0A507QRG4_MONPU|nr:hypothetical protein MPDQ_001573 [Monascus purpureus]BDD56041.1 hypothetical protein MAP00_001523 [Monascus purpureus]
MEPDKFIDPNLTRQDLLVLQSLLRDAREKSTDNTNTNINKGNGNGNNNGKEAPENKETSMINHMESLNNPQSPHFDPTVFVTWDTPDLQRFLPSIITTYLLNPYIHLGRKLVRVETDVVMLTHLLLYCCTSVPSAVYLYCYRFTWIHAVLHWLMQSYFTGTYTLMMHQHIHMNGILTKRLAFLDALFPYILNPLMGHTWNSYYYHHVKHHHVEGNGPDDLSSTIYYQRDSVVDFAKYVGRFLFLVWLELPLYFLRRGKLATGLKAGAWELGNYLVLYLLWRFVSARATVFVFLLPLLQLRIGLMVGNWGQHAFVDEVDPASDFRSSTTLVDVASNRFCYNDGYHTSHHLNPRRHWRDHPVAFLKQKDRYAEEHALVFRNIDYIMLTVNLLRKDYVHLAKCLVPMGDQIPLSLEEKAAMLRGKARKFTEADIEMKFRGK